MGLTFLTLTALSLVDFLLDSVLEGFCFLLRRKVQADLTVLRPREATDKECFSNST